MARYIDADKFLDELEKQICDDCIDEVCGACGVGCARAIAREMPDADVAPKSEVDRLVDKWIGEENLTQDEKTLRLIEALRDEAKRYERYYFNHEYDKLIAEAKQEVAREIFEEVENRIGIGHDILDVWNILDELKKKYTGEQT
jgi:hypothetical protein